MTREEAATKVVALRARLTVLQMQETQVGIEIEYTRAELLNLLDQLGTEPSAADYDGA